MECSHEFHCTICADDDVSSENPIITLNCSHSFHAHCVLDWFRSHHDTCPNCRSIQTNMFTVRLTPRQRIARMMRVQQLAPPLVRAHLKKYQHATTKSKDVRKELREFHKKNRSIIRNYNRLRARYERWARTKDDMATLLGRTVVPGVPLIEAVEYNSDYQESDDDET